MCQQSEPPERALTFEAGSDVIRERDLLVRCTQDKLSRVQNERLIRSDFNQPRQIGLVFRRINVWVLVIVEQAKVAVDSNVNA